MHGCWEECMFLENLPSSPTPCATHNARVRTIFPSLPSYMRTPWRVSPGLIDGLWRGRAEIRGGAIEATEVMSPGVPINIAVQQRTKLLEYYQSLECDSERKTKLLENWEQSGHVLQWVEEHINRQKLYKTGKVELTQQHQIDTFIDRIVKGEPLAYIFGTQPFGPLELKCEPPILIPRPETEYLVEHLAQLIVEVRSKGMELASVSPLRILDLCTGTGCMAILLQHRLREARVNTDITAVDKSLAAIRLARRNHAYCVSHSKGQSSSEVMHLFRALHIDLFDSANFSNLIDRHGPFDVIVSNPPYITAEEYETLDYSVREYEAKSALLGDIDGRSSDGLLFYRRIAQMAADNKQPLLRQQSNDRADLPNLVVEVGHTQARAVQDIFSATGCFDRISLWKDPWDVERGVLAWIRRSL